MGKYTLRHTRGARHFGYSALRITTRTRLGTPVYIFGRSVIAKGDTLAEAVAAFREGIRASRGAK